MAGHIAAIFWKQVKDTFKNKTILIQFVMFPVLTLIMENAVKIEGMPEHFFVNLFAVMYVGMAPLTSMAAIISEEKEQNTLKVLRMSNVSPAEYLIGVGSYLWIICLIGACVMGIGGGYEGKAFGQFLMIMGIGILVSMFMGAAIGTWSKNQMMATSITVPVMMIFSFLPMLSMFNEGIEKVARVTYSQQIHSLIGKTGIIGQTISDLGTEPFVVIGLNMLIVISLFWIGYRKKGME